VIRAIVHTASGEIRNGRISEAEAEAAMLTTAVAAISPWSPPDSTTPRVRILRGGGGMART
jgi:hypothetical protein